MRFWSRRISQRSLYASGLSRRAGVFYLAGIGGRLDLEGVDSVVFPSATGDGRNVAVYLANVAAGSVVVRNRAEVLAALRRPRVGKRGR
jgi:hypothetical protein